MDTQSGHPGTGTIVLDVFVEPSRRACCFAGSHIQSCDGRQCAVSQSRTAPVQASLEWSASLEERLLFYYFHT